MASSSMGGSSGKQHGIKQHGVKQHGVKQHGVKQHGVQRYWQSKVGMWNEL
jgi:hypothetical protein